MDKSYDTSSSSNTHNNGGSKDQLLKNLNKASHKISKPTRKNAAFDNHQQQMRPPPPLPPPQHQPPVYNINMSDFRDVVQKLTGSQSHLAHDSFLSPPPIQPPKQPSSRLQRIRPPPLPQITNRPSTLILPPHPQPIGGGFLTNFRPPPPSVAPLSPLPPFPPVYTAAESPISAYIRCFLQDSVSNQQGTSALEPLISPKWNTNTTTITTTDNVGSDPPLPNVSAPPPMPSQPPSSMFIPPFSPLPFGCLSPMSPYTVYSPGQLGFPQFPPSFT
ncbi:VQ motif-containing protein 9-like [Impatiens glandulifera]|uniref:VQ motif-containing protein 9-like n=1 Tax=Impatiens glandulifera TaxID=253017 RepID=UPI001FB133A5|nr:VQ motif-containing protein 9-like [Impatiens glandulifera]